MFYVEIVVNTGIIYFFTVPLHQLYCHRCCWSLGVIGLAFRLSGYSSTCSGIGDLTNWRKKLWNVAVLAICWSLWLERNNRIFGVDLNIGLHHPGFMILMILSFLFLIF